MFTVTLKSIISNVSQSITELLFGSTDTIDQLEELTAKEEAKASHLGNVLAAKKALLAAKTKSYELERQISELGKK